MSKKNCKVVVAGNGLNAGELISCGLKPILDSLHGSVMKRPRFNIHMS